MTGENNGMYMPVVPQYGGMGGDGFLGGNGAWFILILLALFGWGNGFGGWGGNPQGGVGQEVQRGFDQAALTNGLNALQTQQFNLQNAMQTCCCENRAGVADLKYTVATEACADRNAVASALRDVLEANNAATQKILDTMCQDKIDSKNERIAELQQQLQMAQLAASQNAQTAQILANNEAQTAALERYLAPTPVPAYVVQNPNGCNTGYNYGCGCGA